MIVNVSFLVAVFSLASAIPYDRQRIQPSRAMSWTGWMPGSGMSVFTSSDDQWNQYEGLKPPSPSGSNWGVEDRSNEEIPNLKPFDEEEKDKKPFDDERDRKPVKPLYHKPRRGHSDDDYEDDRRRSGSNANASFNAWFPIMLGMYPGSESRKSGSNSRPEESGSVAAIANSVNHGRSGVASSHAIVYSGQPKNQEQNLRKF